MKRANSFTGNNEVLRGYSELQANFDRLVRNMPLEEAGALFAEAQIERTESMRRTPVDHGNLRGSHIVMPPKLEAGRLSVTIAVGGEAAPYAIPVHENLEAFHKVGQAKFLESTIKESASHITARVARRIDLRRAMET